MVRRTPALSLIRVAVALMLVAVITRAGATQASPPPQEPDVTSRQFVAQPPLVIPAAAFSVIGPPPPASAYFFSSAGGYIRGGYVCVTAPAYLPQNARVTRVDASLYDGEANASARVYLYRVSNLLPATVEMAYLQTPLDSASMQVVVDRSINAPRVRYPEYAYYAFACLDSANTRLYSLRIHYDVQVYLPVVMRNTW
jgi:hypothetical protein